MNIWLGLVDLFDDLSDAVVKLFVSLNFLSRINEEDVGAPCCGQQMFLLSPAFSDSPFKKISLHCSFEHLLGNRYHYSIPFCPIVVHIQKPKPGYAAVLSFVEKLSN